MNRVSLLAAACAALAAPLVAAKKAPAPAPAPAAPVQTTRAMSELAGKFKWDLSPEEAMKIVTDEIVARYDEKIQKETISYKQDKLLKEKADAVAKVRDSYVKFDGQKTGWDVSLIDHEFRHRNDESMFVIWEDKQRRFLFFWKDKLWKQFIAFNADNPAFAGKTFDDFANLIQKRYGPAAVIFQKKRTSDEQAFDHLEWPPSGDYVLWAVDLTGFYGNFCLSLMRTSAVPLIDKARIENNPRGAKGSELVDSVLKNDSAGKDHNADVVDEITGRVSRPIETAPEPQRGDKKKKGGATPPAAPAKKQERHDNTDPLDGMKL